MNRFFLSTTMALSFCSTLFSQSTRRANQRTFELTAVAPPKPALTYQLRFDDLTDREPGNAAILYLDAVLLMAPDANDQAEKALAAFEANDTKTFDSLAAALRQPALFEELDLAARREQCDWQAPLREMGVHTLLPHLEPLLHGVARSIKVRGLSEIEQGRLADALKTLRLGYELSDRIGRHSNLVPGLIALNITVMMNDGLAELMTLPDSPNLYWALAEAPSRRAILCDALESQRMSGELFSIPNLMRFKAGEELSADQWRAVFADMARLNGAGAEGSKPRPLDPVEGTSPQVLHDAQLEYAQTRHLTVEQAAKIHPEIVLGSYYFRQCQISVDEMFKLRGLPYPQWLSKAREYSGQIARSIQQQPANPFLQGPQPIDRMVWRFASCDRETAALTAVEAIRSYAAANGGKLPQRLDDVTDTPVPANPATGRPFEYQVQNDAALLSDSKSQEPLTYTIRIRK